MRAFPFVEVPNRLFQAFKKHGLEKDDPIGQKFDPNFHSAVFEVDDESKEAGTVAVVLKVVARKKLACLSVFSYRK